MTQASRIAGTGSVMPQIGRISATWAPGARAEMERFVVNSRAPGAVLSLFRNGEDPSGIRWSYTVMTPDRIQALEAVIQGRGVGLLYDIDGVTVAISNAVHAKALDGLTLDVLGSGYLVARPTP
jgi:hypothetical protein